MNNFNSVIKYLLGMHSKALTAVAAVVPAFKVSSLCYASCITT